MLMFPVVSPTLSISMLPSLACPFKNLPRKPLALYLLLTSAASILKRTLYYLPKLTYIMADNYTTEEGWHTLADGHKVYTKTWKVSSIYILISIY